MKQINLHFFIQLKIEYTNFNDGTRKKKQNPTQVDTLRSNSIVSKSCARETAYASIFPC